MDLLTPWNARRASAGSNHTPPDTCEHMRSKKSSPNADLNFEPRTSSYLAFLDSCVKRMALMAVRPCDCRKGPQRRGDQTTPTSAADNWQPAPVSLASNAPGIICHLCQCSRLIAEWITVAGLQTEDRFFFHWHVALCIKSIQYSPTKCT